MPNTKGNKWITDGKHIRSLPIDQIDDYLRNNKGWYLGRPKLSIDVKAKLSKAHTGKHLTKEHRANISKTLNARKPLLNRKASKATRLKQSLAKLNKPGNRKGVKASELTRKRLSESHLGHKLSPEAKRKVGEATRKRLRAKPDPFVSKPELVIRNYLSKFFSINPQYRISKHYNHAYDILVYLPNDVKLLIEFDGEYWHSSRNPNWNPKLDAQRSIEALNRGYKFSIINESEFNKYGLSLVNKLITSYYPEFNGNIS